MDLKLIVVVSISAVLMTVVPVDTSNSTTPPTSTPKSTSSVTTNPSTSKSTTLAGKPNVTTPSTTPSTTPTTPSTTPTTPSTTPKPISCSVGHCDDDEKCFGDNGFGLNITCQSGESCAVNETRFNGTYSMYSVSCASTTDCETIQSAGTGACCHTDNCTPDLKAAARANANKNNGCDFPRLNMDVVICIIIILFKIL